MTIYRAQIAITADSALPRDAFVVTPHYTGTDPTALANTLKTQIKALSSMAANPSFTVNIYEAGTPPPHHPVATATNLGTTPNSTLPRETAICLSYYATLNQPRLRGRIYLPACMMPFTAAVRPNVGDLPLALQWGPALFKTLPTGTVAVVYSRVNHTTAPITNYWVDNEWDTVRSRGLKSTTRVLGTVP